MSVVAIKSKPWVDTCMSEDKSQYSNFRETCATSLSKQGKVQKKPKQRSKKNIEKRKKELNLYCTRAYAKKIELTKENMTLTKETEVETSEELERDQLRNFLSDKSVDPNHQGKCGFTSLILERSELERQKLDTWPSCGRWRWVIIR
jgi:hypothetical protein